jgi:competence protein ComEC
MDAAVQPAKERTSRLNDPAATSSSGRRLWPRYQPLVVLTIAFAAGIVLDRYAPSVFYEESTDDAMSVPWVSVWLCSATASLVAWWLLWRRRCDVAAAWLLLTAMAWTGAASHHFHWYLFDENEIGRFAGYLPAPAGIRAVARETPERVPAPKSTPLRAIPAGERSRLLVDVTAIRDGKQWRPARGTCALSVGGHLLGIRAGDRLQVFGQLARPAPPLNPGEFDFAAHARADRQLARMRSSVPECVVLLGQGTFWQPDRQLDALSVSARQLVGRLVGPDRAALASAILLGAREGLQYDETEPYLVTGTIHVLVVSGMNVAILAAGLLLLMRIGWLSRRAGLAVIALVVLSYTLVTGAQPPIVRAAVLAVLLCWSSWTGRSGAAFNSLFTAGLFVLAINPNDLFRAGPQLSFLAVAVLIWVGNLTSTWQAAPDRLDELLAAARPWYQRAISRSARWLGWLLVTSFAVWLSALPLVLHQFHVASPVAVVISPVIWLVVFAAMWSGFFMLVVGWIAPSVGAACGTICGWSLVGLESVVQWAEALPAGHFWAPGPAWWWVLTFYLVFIMVMVWGRALMPARWQLAMLAGWILVGLIPPLSRPWTRDGLDCSFVSVGHGACVVLQSPAGETMLYDAGAIGSPEYATQTIAAYLWHRGIMRIDGIVISHADSDHFNAVPGLLERFRVGTVYVSPVMFSGFGRPGAADGPRVLREAISSAGVPIREIWSGDRLQMGSNVAIEVMHPPRRGIVGNDNANSITIGVEYGGRRLLLPGDLESPGIEDVMAELPYDSDVLLAPHHGSRRSDPPGFANWSKPEWVVVSGGGGDDIQFVRHTYQRTGAKVLTTIESGTIECSIRTDTSLKITSYLSPRPKFGRLSSQ